MEELIETVRQYDVIYDNKSTHYKDQSIRAAVWEEIGEKLKQPAEKCKEDWDKLRNAYTNALKRRKIKRNGRTIHAPWKYENEMKFLRPYLKSKLLTNTVSSPELPECSQPNLQPELPEPQSPENYESEDRTDTPQYWTSSHSQESFGIKSNIRDLYDLMMTPQDLRLPILPKQNFTQFMEEMDETDLFFFSMSKAIKKLPKLDQTKIKLDLHTAISQAEIRYLEKQEKND